jgi:streptomycin 6-kinase
VRECAELWDLRVGEPFADVFEALVLPATRPDGTGVVLKLPFVGRENEHEARALARWDGNGVVRLLAYDAERAALLLERCRPGTPLSDVDPARALDVLIELLPRLWKPADEPFRHLADEAAWWSSTLIPDWEAAGRPFERRLVDAALDAIDQLLSSVPSEQVLVNQDLHPGNVLRAEREPWLVIDPKPLVGEREFNVVPIVRSFELGHRRTDVRRRLDRLTSELGLDRERARLWSIAQIVAWSIDSTYVAARAATATWLLEMGR